MVAASPSAMDAAFGRLRKGGRAFGATPFVASIADGEAATIAKTYTYTYHEMKLIIDGEFKITDETGTEVIATVGDLLYFPKGSTITFSTPDYGVGFFCGQRGKDEA